MRGMFRRKLKDFAEQQKEDSKSLMDRLMQPDILNDEYYSEFNNGSKDEYRSNILTPYSMKLPSLIVKDENIDNDDPSILTVGNEVPIFNDEGNIHSINK